ncbi:MAG: (E)-4-hydroxy-3-methylbut-2-enyl-diphosphate synthase [Deltaproteobacteria bacterium]|nr:(E)-4-hydroxy-3-methylbut-2-enyl-diphosphate synthase [Deltaproteobacteria bacterium]
MSTPRFYKRRQTRTVFVGQIGIGGNNPIRVQSMCTSDTKNTAGVINEIQKLVAAGCEIVRLTVPTKADLNNLKNIRAEMQRLKLSVPLVADIHFTPSIAMDVVPFVEKVRINPGNFIDKKLFKVQEYSDEQYEQELARIEERFAPLVLKCKEHGVAMRIGTNHGSLSDRIMNRYGDSPEGMVESALEFLRIAAKNNYHDIILSMKASNTQVMVNAYRLLAERMEAEGMDYPLHLGVTEAGEGEDGRVKSAVGIGTLLNEGLGDTIRVSLTEDADKEIPVAAALVAPFNELIAIQNYRVQQNQNQDIPAHLDFLTTSRFQATPARRETQEFKIGPLPQGGKHPVSVWTRLDDASQFKNFLLAQNADMRFEGIEIAATQYWPEFAEELKAQNFALAVCSANLTELMEATLADKLCWVLKDLAQLEQLPRFLSQIKDKSFELRLDATEINLFEQQNLSVLKNALQNATQALVLSVISAQPAQDYRLLQKALGDQPAHHIHLLFKESALPVLLSASAELGSLLLAGLGDSIQINSSRLSFKEKLSLSYGVLQACRVRISKTEFIACPSCGRTLFDLQEVTAKIKKRTDHLKGVKIAIMGCIVNGPGEMADADFGYVGTGTGKISLYVGKDCVTRNIPEANALDELIALIKNHGQWVERV